MVGLPKQEKMSTGIERVFRHVKQGVYRELYLHYIHFIDDNGTILRSKLDKTIEGGLFKRAETPDERSRHGEVEYKFPDEEENVRMLALGFDEGDLRYGRR